METAEYTKIDELVLGDQRSREEIQPRRRRWSFTSYKGLTSRKSSAIMHFRKWEEENRHVSHCGYMEPATQDVLGDEDLSCVISGCWAGKDCQWKTVVNWTLMRGPANPYHQT